MDARLNKLTDFTPVLSRGLPDMKKLALIIAALLAVSFVAPADAGPIRLGGCDSHPAATGRVIE